MAELQENDEYGLVDIPLPEQPPSQKSSNEFRPFVMRSNFLDKSAGSGYVEFGKTYVLCSIEGPIEKDREADEDVEDSSVVTIIADDVSDEYLLALDKIVETFVKTELLVNAEVKIYLKVVSNDGGVLAVSSIAIGLALASANIQMYDVPLAATVLFESRQSTSPILDPTLSQCKNAVKNGGGFVTVVSLPNFTQYIAYNKFPLQLGHVLSEGVMTMKQARFATEAAFKYSLTLYEEVSNTIKSSI
ncbi:Pyridoxal phosphate homeostasis protein [Aphelenchoides bicaudatus]|nr:Pyridoxal phosphate homeostasis protein [Aphelenchoides bicaudatus]